MARSGSIISFIPNYFIPYVPGFSLYLTYSSSCHQEGVFLIFTNIIGTFSLNFIESELSDWLHSINLKEGIIKSPTKW